MKTIYLSFLDRGTEKKVPLASYFGPTKVEPQLKETSFEWLQLGVKYTPGVFCRMFKRTTEELHTLFHPVYGFTPDDIGLIVSRFNFAPLDLVREKKNSSLTDRKSTCHAFDSFTKGTWCGLEVGSKSEHMSELISHEAAHRIAKIHYLTYDQRGLRLRESAYCQFDPRVRESMAILVEHTLGFDTSYLADPHQSAELFVRRLHTTVRNPRKHFPVFWKDLHKHHSFDAMQNYFTRKYTLKA